MTRESSEPESEGLSVQKGPASVPDVNPRLNRPDVPRQPVDELYAALVDGDRGALGRAITLVESQLSSDRDEALALLDRCMESGRNSVRIGISGAPGVGKSTFVDSFGAGLVAAGHRVAVLAIDPSSDRTGGSILGDKTRMARLFADPRAFIRPSPSSGALGGVGRRTHAAITLCEAAGYDHVLIETVGVGQSETTVRHMVDTFLLLAQAGSGDELQGIKRGIIEVADVIAVTKADGPLAPLALTARSALRSALTLWPPDETGWRVPVLACSALTGDGMSDVADALAAHREHLRLTGHQAEKRGRQALTWMRDEVSFSIVDRLSARPDWAGLASRLEDEVSSGRMHPFRAAARMLDALTGSAG